VCELCGSPYRLPFRMRAHAALECLRGQALTSGFLLDALIASLIVVVGMVILVLALLSPSLLDQLLLVLLAVGLFGLTAALVSLWCEHSLFTVVTAEASAAYLFFAMLSRWAADTALMFQMGPLIVGHAPPGWVVIVEQHRWVR